MKTLIFLLIGTFCFAHGQKPEDSIIAVVSNKLEAVNSINKENAQLIKKIVAKKEQEERLKKSVELQKSKSKKIALQKEKDAINLQAVKTEPIKTEMEVDFKVYKELVKGDFFYRFFHKDIYKLKFYKIENDEKIYLN